MPRLLSCLACLAFLFATASIAREQSIAPDVEIIGFSPDGRYFAWEQYGYDIATDALGSAIFVVDSQTNAQVEGFPFGVVPEHRDGQYPAKVGGFDADINGLTNDDGTPDLNGLRKLVSDQAAAKLAMLDISERGRRLAGVPLTQRSPLDKKVTPLIFATIPVIPSAIPDTQHIYTLEAKPDPEPEDCYNNPPPARQKQVAFDVISTVTYPQIKDVGRAETLFGWPMQAETCATGLWISDIVAPPGNPGETHEVALLFLTSAWSSASDSASWHGLFVKLPTPSD
jgi:hypothetical protein